MCTLLTVSYDLYGPAVERRIMQDVAENPDGLALLLLDKHGAQSITRCRNAETVLQLLRHTEWIRMWMHTRYATQGEARIDNCHGWSNQGVFYMHNGRIMSPEACLFPVDSQAIGEWLDSGVDFALSELRSQTYANVFFVDLNTWTYYVHRSYSGTLYTDGRGNFATNKVGKIRRPVRKLSQTFHYIYNPGEEGERDLDKRRARKAAEGSTTESTNTDSVDTEDVRYIPGSNFKLVRNGRRWVVTKLDEQEGTDKVVVNSGAMALTSVPAATASRFVGETAVTGVSADMRLPGWSDLLDLDDETDRRIWNRLIEQRKQRGVG